MKSKEVYCSYNNYHIVYNTDTHSFDAYHKKQLFIKNASVSELCRADGSPVLLSDFNDVNLNRIGVWSESCHYICEEFKIAEEDPAYLTLKINVSDEGVRVDLICEDAVSGILKGEILSGEYADIFPVCLQRSGNDLRASVGKAPTSLDHAVYNRRLDTAVSVGVSGRVKIRFDGNERVCKFESAISSAEGSAAASVKENLLANEYGIEFSPINRNTVFPTAPVGWMTWYAVKFDACEENVLRNAEWQAKNLKDYGANALWVDWEWYHKDLTGTRDDGVNSLNPDPEKYPHGMKFVSDKIRELGLIPVLWIGFTNEPCKNEFIEKYPDILLTEEESWCGKYYFDFTNPNYLNKYLPAAVANVHKWGYDAVKFDTLPISMGKHESHHFDMKDSSLSTREAYRQMVQKVKSELGEDTFMLSCSGARNSTVLWASDIFDAARVGEDVFTWDEYCMTVGRVMDFYPLHNIQIFLDPDNVVLRDEFSNSEQAKARLALVSLLGLPMTFGDEFSALSEEKIGFIKKSLPILDIHSSDLCKFKAGSDELLINLAINTEAEEYSLSGVFNLTDKPTEKKLNIKKDFHLCDGKYLVYDFYRDEMLTPDKDGSLTLDFFPYECRILALRSYLGVPQIISTSRHVTQGAAELKALAYENGEISFTASLIKDDSYTVTVYVPDGYSFKEQSGFESYTAENNLLRLTLMPQKTEEYRFSVAFDKI